MAKTDYEAKLSQIRELDYQLMNIDELEGFETESENLRKQITDLSQQVADMEP